MGCLWFHFEHQCKCSSLDIFPVLLKAIFPLAGQSVLCRYIVFFLEETQTTWTWGKVRSRWISSYSWISGNNQFALEVLGLAALLENSDVVFIETFINNQVSEIVLLSPQFFQFGLSLNSFPAFFKILNFLANPLKVKNSEFFAMKFIYMTCQFLHHSGVFWFSEGTVRTTFRFSVFIQPEDYTSPFLILFVPMAHLPLDIRCSHPHRPCHHHHFRE